jgi:hypothetical protein
MAGPDARARLYRRLGLSPVSVDFARARSADAVRSRVERWERLHSGAGFRAVHLERLPLETARELAGVFVSLRERHPAVRPARVDFASRGLDRLLGQATLPEPPEPASIELSACLGHPRCLARIERKWSDDARRSSARGAPPRAAPSRLSSPAMVLVHEFGHLVDDAVTGLGRGVAEHVYGALSLAAHGRHQRRPPRPNQWTAHLLNYPTDDRSGLPGYAAGGARRAAIIRSALAEDIGSRFGRYATTSREELFAEAFTAMYGTPDPRLGAALTALRRALEDVGVARRRRRR